MSSDRFLTENLPFLLSFCSNNESISAFAFDTEFHFRSEHTLFAVKDLLANTHKLTIESLKFH